LTEQAYKRAIEIKREQKRWIDRMAAVSADGRPQYEKQAAIDTIKAEHDRLQKEFEAL
jgi:hypothetical protein